MNKAPHIFLYKYIEIKIAKAYPNMSIYAYLRKKIFTGIMSNSFIYI